MSLNKGIPRDKGPINYKAEYLNKVTGTDGKHVWNRSTLKIVRDFGRVFRNLEGDKKSYGLTQMLGKHHGRDGVFEIIIKRGLIDHQRFVPGGIITGYPNQIVPGISRSVSPVKPWW